MSFQIRFHDVAHSERVRKEGEELATQLKGEFPETSKFDCSINKAGENYETHLHVTGKSLDLAASGRHTGMREALVEAFDRARRQLRKHHDKVIDRHR